MQTNNLILSIIIPAYNGEPFLHLAVHSLISQRVIEKKLFENFEIIIIDDGSKDKTHRIALDIKKKFDKITRKNFIRVIKKENGQYGSVINRGLKEVQGKYFKVLDCDDTFNTSSFIKLIYLMLGLRKNIDVVFVDHTFEKVGSNKQIRSHTLKKNVHPYKVYDTKNVNLPKDIITMHSIIYRTDFLRKINYTQLEGVYYSDSIYSLIPLIRAKNLYYANLPLYRYYIGRDEQSINLKMMVKNRLHQKAVLEYLVKNINFEKIENKSLKKYALVVIRRLIQWQSWLIFSDKSIKNRRKELFDFFNLIKEYQPTMKRQILKGPLTRVIKITRGYFLKHIFIVGVRIYSFFKQNIMAEWD